VGSTPTRRQFLTGVGAVAATGLAGCSDADGESDIVGSSDVFGHAFPYTPSSVNLNPWPGGSYPYDFYTLVYEPKSVWVPGEGRRLTDLVTDLTVERRTATVTFSDEFRWWNGEPVTARDQWVYERIQSATADEDRPAVELVDEYTLRYEFDAELARPMVLSHVGGEPIHTADWLFEEWVDRFEQASTASAHEDVVDELHESRIPLEQALDEGFGNGPYELTEASLNRVMLERFEDHPRAGAIDIPRLWLPVLQTSARDAFVADGKIDGGRGRLAEVDGNPAAFVEELDNYQSTNGTKLVFHWDHPDLRHRAVRDAIQAAIPVDQVVETGGFGDEVAVQTGLSAPSRGRWLGEDRSAFRSRPVAADTDRASELMRSVGYTREGEDWRRPDGTKASIRLRTPIWQNWKFAADVVDQALSTFGFDVDYRQLPDTQVVADVRRFNFDVMLWPSDARAYRTYDVTSPLAATIGYGITDSGTETSIHGKPVSVSLPDRDEPVDLYEEWQRLRTAPDGATARESIATFAHWWNHALPDVQLATQRTAVWGNTRDFDWPEADGATYRRLGPGDRPEFTLLNRGQVVGSDD
jgi:peptide/nickel transport system substrate-binding protein